VNLNVSHSFFFVVNLIIGAIGAAVGFVLQPITSKGTKLLESSVGRAKL
jgi:hypothetical protein